MCTLTIVKMNSNISIHEQNSTICLSFGCLNTCGLRNRLNSPEFIDMASKFDLFAVTEAKLGSYDK